MRGLLLYIWVVGVWWYLWTDNGNSSHASFLLSAYFWELVSYKIYKLMKTKFEEKVYENPQVEIIEVEIEQGFAASPDDDGYGNTDNPRDRKSVV